MLKRLVHAEPEVARPDESGEPVVVRADHVFRRHCLVIALLVTVHLLLTLVHATQGRLQTLWKIFWISGEANVPAFFSAAVLLVVALVAMGPVAISDRPENRLPWRLAGALLLFMSLDEAAAIHEKAQFFADGAAVPLLWMSAYALVLLTAAVVFFRFWLHLPVPTRTALAVAGLVFLSGAVGVELQERSHVVEGVDMWRNLPLVLSMTVEETLEMLGAALALRALLRHIALVRDGPFTVRVTP